MNHFYAHVPDLKNARRLVKLLKKMEVPLKDIKLLATNKDHQEMSQLFDANLCETTDLIPSLIRGALIGGIIGLTTILIISQFYSESFVIGGGTIFGFSVLSILFGAWTSSLIGVSVTNPALKPLETALDKGEVVLQVNVTEEQEHHILRLLKLKHPDIFMQIASVKVPLCS